MQTSTNTLAQHDTGNEKLYDLCMIEKLCRGNQEQVKQMIKAFINQVPQAIINIRQAYGKSDFDQVRKEAHRIKPVLSFYAVIKVEDDILQIEKAAGSLTQTEFESKLNKVDRIVSGIVAHMNTTFDC